MAKSKIVALDGAHAVAEAMRQINPDVVAAYPITPQTAIVQTFSNFVADGLVDTEFVAVESEHGAMSTCIGASAAGGRVMTATASAGLALMWEVVYVASSLHLPIVMPVVNRALSAPLNIHCDHSDSMGTRDAGWMQLYSENPQEAYDNVIQAVRIAEELLSPVMIMQDGFITGHGVERVEVLNDEVVKGFIGEYKPKHSLLDVDNPATYGSWDMYDFYFEHKRQQTDKLSKAMPVIVKVGEEYGQLTGRKYGIFEAYGMDDAEMAIVVLSSASGTARMVVRELREKGLKIGLIKPRVFRPFPAEEFAEALANVKAVGVLDRSIVFGAMNGDGPGPLYLELCAALFAAGNGTTRVVDYIFGLGGRDIIPAYIEQVTQDLAEIAETGKVKSAVNYLGLRE
jgi:pyruvate ferredoxin oxidoreductase alpha subunit